MNIREIKFRVWSNGQMKKLQYPECLHYSDDRLTYWDDYGHSGDASSIIMQWTGLLDKNNNHVYEGDKTHDGVIEFNIETCCYIIRRPNGTFIRLDIRKENIEIIGNIYEHPNLLKQ